MAAHLLFSQNPTRSLAFPSTHSLQNGRSFQNVKCINKTREKEIEVSRRSANYPRTICDHDFIQSLKSDYGETRYIRRAESLRDYARRLLKNDKDKVRSLELIDTLQRLGVSYHFGEEIKQVIEERLIDARKEDDLHYAALRFRILRQHGYMISQDAYERKKKKNPLLLELAKLDYNICQAGYQSNVKAMSRWWKDHRLSEKLPFSRDRLPESFIWGMETISWPQYGHATEGLTLVSQLITTIDDIYDVYGTIEELELFTHAIERWDLQVLEELPEYMRHCYLALFNFLNEIGYKILVQQGVNIIPFLKKKDEQSRGDVLKAVQCYMHEKGVSQEAAHEHVKQLIDESWMKMNKHLILGSSFPRDFVASAMDHIRMAHSYYTNGDGFGSHRTRTFDLFKSLVVDPIQLVDARE